MLQRILHSEIHAFHGLKEKTAERFLHVGQSLAFLHFTVPDIIATFYALYLHGAELWKHRKDIHLLALIYPIVFYLLNRAVTWFRTKLVAEADEKVKKFAFHHQHSDVIFLLTGGRLENERKNVTGRLSNLFLIYSTDWMIFK